MQREEIAPQGNYVTAFDWENIVQIEQVIGHTTISSTTIGKRGKEHKRGKETVKKRRRKGKRKKEKIEERK